MKLAHQFGRFGYYRGKGQLWVEMVRSWIMPAAFGGGFAKYLGLQSRWSVVVAVLIPIVVEGLGTILGRWLYKHGGVEQDYSLAALKDPYKVQSLALQAETARLLLEIRESLDRSLGPR